MRRAALIVLSCLSAPVAVGVGAAEFVRGNSNGDEVVDVSDAVFTLLHLFAGADAGCRDAMDCDDDGLVDLTDVVSLLTHLFLRGGPLPTPGAACGADPTPDDLTCLEGSATCPALLEVAVESGTRIAASGDALAYDLFYPTHRTYPPPPFPALVLTHGFARTKERHRANASYLAERGTIVLAPDLSSLLGGEADQLRNIANTAEHVEWLVARSLSAGDPLEGLLDPGRIALAGHSAGGAVTLEATLVLQRRGSPPAAVCLLDAVPWDRTSETAPQLLPLPFCTLRSEPSSCNSSGGVRSLLDRLSFPVEDVKIVDATHCDPENPTDALCTLFCGGTSSTRRAHYQRLLFLFLKDAFVMPSLEGSSQTYAGLLAELEASGQVLRNPAGQGR